jgi:hypothetical protein
MHFKNYMIKTLKEKRYFYLKASTLLKSWKDVYHNSRSYADHCVNVKRSSDYFDIDILLKKINAGKFADEIKKQISEDNEIKRDYYDDFLSFLWEQCIYELSDIEEITKGSKDEHKKFIHIKHDGTLKAWPRDDKSILWADGRSGGWACFNSYGQSYADELEDFINENYTAEGSPADSWDNDRMKDAQNQVEDLTACLEEVNYIINYIKRFNDSNKFIDYIQDQAEQILYTLQEDEAERLKDEAAKVNNFERASLELKPKIEALTSYIDKYITKEPEKTKIIRQIKALKSVIKNAA